MNSATKKTLIALPIAAGLLWAYLYFGTATIQITSDPSGAVVQVDGRQRGLTPIDRLELDAGNRLIVVKHSHFAPYREQVRLARGDHETRHVILVAGKGTLNLLSNPRGAWVEVDGERLAALTPTQLEVESGSHVVRMGQAERFVIEETHTVRDGETLDVNLNLNIDPHGSLSIDTSPAGAQIEFLGEDLVYEPNMRIRMGDYSIRVSKSGYRPTEFEYSVRYGDNRHRVVLERAYGELSVKTRPPGADVSLSYRDGGRERQRAYTGPVSLPVGAVEVRARSLGYRTRAQRVVLKEAGTTVDIALTPMNVQVGSEIQDRLSSGGVAPTMVVLPAGHFQMGDAEGSLSERHVRRVSLTQPFAVSKYEITIGDYRRYVEATSAKMPEQLDGEAADVAIAYVGVPEALDYAAWVSSQTGERYRLPSEAEWEYAARAGSTSDYFFGDDPNTLCAYGNLADRAANRVYRDWDTLECDDGQVKVGAVGRYRPNPFGLYDVYGNVSEWVLDCGMPDYETAPTDGRPARQGRHCNTHGFRGGSWDSMAIEAKSAYRNSAANANDDRGIRLVREL